MTTEHTDALRKAVDAHKAVTDAVRAESKRIADEREKSTAGDMAVHGAQNPAGKEKASNG